MTSIVIRFLLGRARGAAYGNKSWVESEEASEKEEIMNIKEKLASASKKERTPQQQKAMTILNWVATAVCIVVIVFALVVAIFTIAGSTNDNHLTQFGDKIYLNVASDSMEPTFNTSDVLIATAFDYQKQLSELKVGQVVTFKTTVRAGGATYEIYNTHRIVHINYENDGLTVRNFTTRGDNQEGTWQEIVAELEKEVEDQNKALLDKNRAEIVTPASIVATWGSVDGEGNFKAGKMLKGVGGFSNWIQDTENFGANQKTRFFCVVVLPLILLFVIYAFILVRTLVIAKLENQRKVQSEQVVSVDGLSDEEKRRLAQELLASLQASAGGEKASDAETADNATAQEAPVQEEKSDEQNTDEKSE